MERPEYIVTAFGSARFDKLGKHCQEAYKFGQLCADEGWGVATGGGFAGIMNSVSKGCYNHGGWAEAICIRLPFEERTTRYTYEKEHHVKFSTRQEDLMNAGDAFVAFPGGLGTLYEVFYYLTEVSTKKREREPFVFYNTEFWTDVINLERVIKEGALGGEVYDSFVYADTPEEAIERIKKWQ